MKSLVEVKDLSVSYYTYAGEVQAVRGISFNISEGKTVALVGESGCGKSVTAKTLLGLIEKPGKVKNGSVVLFREKDILNNSKKEWNDFRGKDCSMIFQDALVSLNPTKSIGKQIIENLKNHQKENKQEMWTKAVKMLAKVGIPDPETCMNKYPHELSGGMRQRVMIAMAMITKPELLIADEPTTALDVTIQAQILELMQSLQKKLGMAIIMVTHDLGVIADMCDEIIVMYGGRVCERGTAEDIFYRPHHEYTKGLLRSIPNVDRIGEKLIPIPGTPINLLNMPKGCAFCPRCEEAMKICIEEQPPEMQMPDGHFASCWLNVKAAMEEEKGGRQ